MNHTYTKKEALQIVITSAKEYAELQKMRSGLKRTVQLH